MRQRKLRVIKPAQKKATEAYGITIPPKIAIFYKNTYFTIHKKPEGILLLSGTKLEISNKELEKLDLEQFKI